VTLFLAILLGLFFVALHTLIGGAASAFALPAYAFLGLIGLLSLASFRRQRSGADPWCLLSAILLALYIQGRALLSPYAYSADVELLLAQACLIVYLLTALVITAPADRLAVMGFLAVLTLGNTAVGLYQFTRDYDFTFWGIGRFAYGWRASGFFICPNHTACFFAITLLLAAGMLLFGRFGATRKVALIGFIAATLLGIVITGSRGGMLGLAIGGFVLALLALLVWRNYYMWRWWKTLLICVGLVLVAVAGLVFVQRLPVAAGIVARFKNAPADMNWRLEAWQLGLRQWKENPVLGAGAGTFVQYARTHRPMTKQADLVKVHNDFIETGSEYGAVGVALLLFCLGTHFRRWWISFHYLAFQRLPTSGGAGSNALAMNLGALAAVLAVMGAACFDFNMQIPGVAVVAAFAFAILSSPGPVERRTRSRSSAKSAPEVPLVAVDPERVEPLQEIDKPSNAVPARVITMTGRVLIAACGLVLIAWATRWGYPEYLTYHARLMLLNEADYGRAIPMLQDAVRWKPRNHLTYYYLGECQRHLALSERNPLIRDGLYFSAEKNFRECLRWFPSSDRGYIGLGKVLDYQGRLAESKEVWDKLIASDPLYGRNRLHYGKHLYTIGDSAGAIRQYQLAGSLDRRLAGNASQLIEQARGKLAEDGQTDPLLNRSTAPTRGPDARQEREEEYGVGPKE
jgi:O-antigen ligase